MGRFIGRKKRPIDNHASNVETDLKLTTITNGVTVREGVKEGNLIHRHEKQQFKPIILEGVKSKLLFILLVIIGIMLLNKSNANLRKAIVFTAKGLVIVTLVHTSLQIQTSQKILY